MDALSCRDLAEVLGIGKSMAAEILALPNAPTPDKFKTQHSYLAKLCRHALRHNYTHDAIIAAAGNRKRGSPKPQPANLAVASGPEPEHCEHTGAGAGARAATDVTDDDVEAAARMVSKLLTALGTELSEQVESGRFAEAMGLFDRFVKVQGEFRQTIKELDKRREDRLLLLPRDDVYHAVGSLYVCMRGFGDAFIRTLLQPTNLPAWLSEAGVTADFQGSCLTLLRRHIEDFTQSRFNDMRDALTACAVPIDDLTGDLRSELRNAMADELEQAAEQLRG